MVARVLQGVSFDEEMIALDLINKVGPGGHLLTNLGKTKSK